MFDEELFKLLKDCEQLLRFVSGSTSDTPPDPQYASGVRRRVLEKLIVLEKSGEASSRAGKRYDICMNGKLCEGYIQETVTMEGELTHIIHFWDKDNNRQITTRAAVQS